MLARWFTLIVWAVVAATALFWGLKLLVRPAPAPPRVQVVDTGAAQRGDLTRVLGADAPRPQAAVAPEPAPDARFNLLGVLSPRAPQAAREGVALIAVDGKTPKAFRVGALVDGTNVLQSVSARGAALGPRNGATLIALKITAPAAAATGVLAPLAAPAAGLPPGAVQPDTVLPIPPGSPMNSRATRMPAGQRDMNQQK
jgi:general secretion pathway protein C